MDVAFEDELELGLAAAVAHHRIEIFHPVAVLWFKAGEALGFLALGGEGFSLALGLHLGEMVADVWQFLETNHLHRHSGVRCFHGDTTVVDERSDFSCEWTANEGDPHFERAGLDNDGCSRAAAGNDAGFDDCGAGGGLGIGFELEDLSLEGD